MKRPSLASLEKRCSEFNAAYPVGSLVEYHPVIGEPEYFLTRIRHAAYVLSGHTAVCFVDGKAGCVALDAVIPADKQWGLFF